jgi:hypothetical protein
VINIEEFTICLHCGFSQEIINAQMESLKPVENEYKIHWNNRIDRYPKTYTSYSQLINHAVATSPTEWVVLINDRTGPTADELRKMIKLLHEGYACVLLYNVGFMGFSKELIRTIGWWDERFILGGYDDRDWVYRIRQHDLALYESLESTYDFSFKSPLNGPPGVAESQPHWLAKYDQSHYDTVYKVIPDEQYPHWDLFIGDSKPEIRSSWKKWADSQLYIQYNGSESGSSMLNGRNVLERF